MPSEIGVLGRIASTLAEGLSLTLELSALAIVLAAAWAIPVVLLLMSRQRALAVAGRAYVEIVRNTPVLVQMYFIFFGLSMAGYRLSGFTAGLIALVLQNGAYIAEIYRAGIQSISPRQTEAGLAIGMTPGAAFRIVVFPQALRKVLPPLANQGVVIIKDTSLVATLSVAELTFQARLLADRTAAVFEIFLTLALLYLALTSAFSALMRLVEWRLRIVQ
jgi:His/Glu/Gln/Arg/opine family amino acid ABC transporter permease subunit